MLGCNAISAPEQAIASAAKTRLALPESASRESMSSAHEITIALSKNNAQSDSISAAPRRLFLRRASIIAVALAAAPAVAALPVAVGFPVAVAFLVALARALTLLLAVALAPAGAE